MRLKKGRFDHLTHGEAIALLRELEGPLLELVLSGDSSDDTTCDMLGEVFHVLGSDPRVQLIFPTEQESESWRRFKLEHGEGALEIGEFVYVPGSVRFLASKERRPIGRLVEQKTRVVRPCSTYWRVSSGRGSRRCFFNLLSWRSCSGAARSC